MSNCASFLSEVHRCLTPKGVFIIVSYGTPENREIYLKKVSPNNFLINISIARI
jgi:cyclopropane fatty-acyl-phospholipid synthase-like methyltransferase